jgi:molybdopterin converting factor small subunit
MTNLSVNVRVEFLGVPRLRAGVASLDVSASDLGSAFAAVCQALPEVASSCFSDGELRPEYLVSLNGNLFTRDRSTPLNEGDCVLLLSADVGG